jgi:threonylcarbamoyladenosine tRNA methylthiotransferase MtaB
MGCRANLYDGHVLHQGLAAQGWVAAEPGEQADLVVINSCTVTSRADRDSRKLAGRLKRQFEGATVVMTGCGAEITPEKMAEVPEIDRVVGNQDKHRLAELVLASLDQASPTIVGGVKTLDVAKARHAPERQWPSPEQAFVAPTERSVRTRTFLKVQEGCDAFCTFCIIPFARGPGRSLRPSNVIKQVREVEASGAREVVLTGTAVDTYGQDLSDDLAFDRLVEAVLEKTHIERLRLPSLDPIALSPRLRAIMARETRLCPHAHVALQSPHSGILKRMKRRYTADDVRETLRGLEAVGAELEERRGLVGGVFVGMDVITGFPGETEAIFQWTLERLRALPWHRLHVFPYSERSETAATRLDGVVEHSERKRRVRALMALSLERLVGHYEAVVARDPILDVLVEGEPREGMMRGRTSNFYRVRFPSGAEPPEKNSWVRVRPEAVRTDAQLGEAELVCSWVS